MQKRWVGTTTTDGQLTLLLKLGGQARREPDRGPSLRSQFPRLPPCGDGTQSIDQSVECGVRGEAPTDRVERRVVPVSYAYNKREDIAIDQASWLEGNCEPGSKQPEKQRSVGGA
jgi:hypothetical protein